MSTMISHKTYVQRLYRQALRTAYDHYSFHWDVYRQHCLAIRARFDANKNEQNLVRIQALIKETEEELHTKAHPRPFKYPTAIGGVKYGRNAVPPLWLVEHGQGNWQSDEVVWEKIGK